MTVTLTGTSINFPVGTQEKSVGGFVPGIGMTWQSVTSSRAVLTTYTNATGRPIMVFVKMADSGSNACVFDIDGVTVSATSHNGGNGNSSFQGIIPTGSTYRVSNGSWPIGSWQELRP
jgi:hypothetical protein